MAKTAIRNGVLVFACEISLGDTDPTFVSTNIENTVLGIIKCYGQLASLSIEVALAAGNDDLTDFLIFVKMHQDGSFHANQDTAGDAVETTVAGGANALTINLGNPWEVRFQATSAFTSGAQVLSVRGTMSALGITD